MAFLRRSVKCLVLSLALCSALLLSWHLSGRVRSAVALGVVSGISRGKSGSVHYEVAEREGALVQHTNVGDSLQITGRQSHRLAVIIPFRNREAHLKEFVKHMVPYLVKQQLLFHIFVIEQSPVGLFNRAKLSNIGFKLAKERKFDYVCFHDVDMIPLNGRNPYTYPETNPTHLATCVEQFGYKLPFPWYCGGVILFTMEQYEKINGMGNVYFGWGKEDDDLYRRIASSGFKLERPEPSSGSDCLGRYQSLAHGDRDYSSSSRNNELLSSSRLRQGTDGLNNVVFSVEEENTAGPVTRVIVNACLGVTIIPPEVVNCQGTTVNNRTL